MFGLPPGATDRMTDGAPDPRHAGLVELDRVGDDVRALAEAYRRMECQLPVLLVEIEDSLELDEALSIGESLRDELAADRRRVVPARRQRGARAGS